MKKNYEHQSLWTSSSLKKLGRIMRFTIFLLLVFALNTVASESYSQKANISLNLKNTTIEKALDEIEKQSGFVFLYSQEVLNLDKVVDLSLNKKDVYEVLAELFKDDQIKFTIIDNKIILSCDLRKQLTTVAQPIKVTGKVIDINGEALPGVNVYEKTNPQHGVITGIDGSFSIEVDAVENILVFSFIGYQEQEVQVGGSREINITLMEEITDLDEVVVVGFGTQKKANLTGAVAQVNMEEVLGERPVTSIANALQGTMPGVQITGGSQPGSNKIINIRGTTSISALGDDPLTTGEPLVLIDNVPGDINLLNPEDVESVSVLKDAASAAIYGARAAFGVILVTTKRSKDKKMTLNYSNNFAFQNAINGPEMASMEDYLQYFKDFRQGQANELNGVDIDDYMGWVSEYKSDPSGFAANHPNDYVNGAMYLPEGANSYLMLKATDPTKAILDNYGFQQTHNISATGGSESLMYRLALGYTDQDGPLITSKDSYDRINLTSYVSTDLTDWLTQSVDAKFTRSNRSYVEDGELWGVFWTRYSQATPLGSFPLPTDLEGKIYPSYSPNNFLNYVDPSSWLTENTRIFSRTAIHPFKGFEGILEYTYDTRSNDYKRFTNNETMIRANGALDGTSATPTYYNNKTTIATNSLNTYGTYNLNLGDHGFKVMAGYSQETRDYELLSANKIDMINPEKPSFSGSTGVTKVADTYSQYAIRSGFFRFNYNYKEKYLLEVNGRYDGSSKFPKNERFGFFPSVSMGWRLSQEGFMDWSDSWLDMAKVRFSYGELGNQAGVGYYGYLPEMESYYASWIVNGEQPLTLGAPDLVRSDYTWEVVQTTDIGFDFSVLNNRLSGTYDWYQRNTIGMLAPGSQLSAVIGADAPDQNAADLETKGWELAIQWKDRIGDWRYGIGFNLYDSKTVITKYDNVEGLFYDSANNRNYRVGMEIGEIWGYVTDGFYTADDFASLGINNYVLKDGVVSVEGVNPRPGDIKYKNLSDNEEEGDINEINNGGNTAYEPGDRKIIGNRTPRYQYGINANVGWKGFDLSILLQGVGKRDAWVSGDLMFGTALDYIGVYSEALDYWTPVDYASGDYTAANPNAYLPAIYEDNKNRAYNTRVQTKYLQDASYLRVKNITLSYTLPQQIINRAGLTSSKIFFSGENMFTFHHLNKGFDPERLSWGYPFYATYSFGINLTL